MPTNQDWMPPPPATGAIAAEAPAQWSAPWSWGATGDPNKLRTYSGSIDFTLDPKAEGTAGDYGGWGWGAGQPIKLFTTEQDFAGKHVNPGDIYYPGEANGGFGSWSPTTDYGLGAGYEGVMPIAHNQLGQPVKFFTLTTGGGGATFDSAAEAKAARDQYQSWYSGQHPAAKPGTPPTPPPPPGKLNPTVQTTGELADPGAGEDYFKETMGFYKSPTEAHQKWDQMKDQPTEQEQTWNAYSGIYQNPSTEQGQTWDAVKGMYQTPGTEQSELYGNWESLFSNPAYLDDYYRRQGQIAQTTLDRKAASGGWGDSGAAARATANIDRDFADRALLAKGQWAQTGMGLAGAADRSINEKATTGMGLAGAADRGLSDKATTGMTLASGADRSRLDRLSAASGVDAADLARISGGQVAAGNAQNLEQARLGGKLSSQQGIADDMSQLTSVFTSNAEAQKFATDMAAIQVQYQQGNLSLTQAVNQAQEAMSGMQVANQALLNSYIMGKLLNKSDNPNNLPLG